MTVDQNYDHVKDELRLTLRFPMRELAEMTEEITKVIRGALIQKIMDSLDQKSIQEEVTKGVILEMCKQAADRFIEENGDEIVEDAREALEDMLEEIIS